MTENNGDAKEVLIELSGVSVQFGQKKIFKDITLEVRKGDILVLRGKSGSGYALFPTHMMPT